jgi:hypothetical protein
MDYSLVNRTVLPPTCRTTTNTKSTSTAKSDLLLEEIDIRMRGEQVAACGVSLWVGIIQYVVSPPQAFSLISSVLTSLDFSSSITWVSRGVPSDAFSSEAVACCSNCAPWFLYTSESEKSSQRVAHGRRDALGPDDGENDDVNRNGANQDTLHARVIGHDRRLSVLDDCCLHVVTTYRLNLSRGGRDHLSYRVNRNTVSQYITHEG